MLRKVFGKFKNFVICHPILTMFITWFVITFIDGYKTRNWNFAGCALLTLIIFAFFAPFIRNARAKKERKEEIDYLAKRIAEEQKGADRL